MIVLDTDHLSVLLDERNSRHFRLRSRLKAAEEAIAIPIVSIEEQLRGWLAQIHRLRDAHDQVIPYLRLRFIFTLLRDWPIVDWEQPAADYFKRLRSSRIRIGTADLKIASIALANNALLLSANLRDFEKVPGLRVEDWL